MTKPSKKKIGIDFDDVIFGFNRAFIVFQKERYGIDLHYEDIITFDINQVWNMSKDESFRRVDEFLMSPYHDMAKPVPGAAEAINILKERHELHIVTSRKEEVRGRTIAWLDKAFPGAFAGVHFTGQFSKGGGKVLKSEVCKQLLVDTFVEDALVYAHEIAEAGIDVFLLDSPWNQERTMPTVTRVKSWDEIVEKMD